MFRPESKDPHKCQQSLSTFHFTCSFSFQIDLTCLSVLEVKITIYLSLLQKDVTDCVYTGFSVLQVDWTCCSTLKTDLKCLSAMQVNLKCVSVESHV